MKKFELLVEGFHSPLTASQIAELFHARRVRRSDPCRETGRSDWRTLDELFPLLKYDSSSSASPSAGLPKRQSASALDGSDNPASVPRAMTSSLKAGWICFGIALLLSWFFPLANAFFAVAVITAIVAMCTHQVNRGLALLISSFVGSVICTFIFFSLVLGTIGIATGAALKQANARMKERPRESLQRFNRASSQLPSSIAGLNTQIAAQIASANTQPLSLPGAPLIDERQRSYDSAMAQQREAETRKATDQAQRDRNVREAELQRDLAKGKEQRLQQLQNSIDWNDRAIRQARDLNVSTRFLENQRDALLQQKAKLQGY